MVRTPLLRLASVVAGVVLAGAAAVPLAATAATAPLPVTGSAAAASIGASTATSASAKTLLSRLRVAAESHRSTYSRTRFKAWVDPNRDCENTRAEVLKAESRVTVTKTSTGCTVKTGRWISKYDGRTVTAATYLDIDHLVPLAEAWSSGAYGWTTRKRAAFANDIGYGASLIAVSVHENRSKGDQEPNAYLPPVKAYRCTYVKNWIAVKYRWGLTVNPLEKTRLTQNLAAYCASLAVRMPGVPDLTRLSGMRATPPAGTPGSGTDRDYGTCANAKAAGADTPYYRGADPEYAYYRDTDGDGVVCE